MTPRNYDKRADEHLAIIRTIALSLPLGQRLRIQNHCDRLAVLYRKQQRHLESLPETDDRTDAQVAGQIAAERSTAERIVADILAGRVVSQRDSDYYKTTAFHSRIADARRLLFSRGYVLRSLFTTDAVTPAGRPFKIYWIDNPNTETK